MRKEKQVDRDIVIHYKGAFYLVTEAVWRHGKLPGDGSLGKPMPQSVADYAAEVIAVGGIIGYVPGPKPGRGEGTFGTVIDLDAILMGRPRK